MQTLRLYIKPEVELIGFKDEFMLELPVSKLIVDDEAANDSFFDDNMDDDTDPFFED